MAQLCAINGCDRQTNFFENFEYGNRCIFHCDKSDEANWGNPENKDVKRFWCAIREQMRREIIENAKEHNFSSYSFPAFEKYNLPISNTKEPYFLTKDVNFWSLNKENKAILEFKQTTNFHSAIFNYKTLFDRITFSHASLVKAEFKGDTSFSYATFNEFVSFNEVNFENVDFDGIRTDKNSPCDIFFIDITIKKKFHFSAEMQLKDVWLLKVNVEEKAFISIDYVECERLKIINLKNQAANIKLTFINVTKSITIKDTMLDKTEFNGLNIENAEVILENTSFIGSHLTKVEWGKINEKRFYIDRQMARQLKSINDAQGETVTANDFYALEMRLRSKDLKWTKLEEVGEKIVQNIHGLVSNHGNDWFLATIWFFAFGFLFTSLTTQDTVSSVLICIPFGIMVLAATIFAEKIPVKAYIGIADFCALWAWFCFNGVYVDYKLLAALVNPLNLKDSESLLKGTSLLLIYICRLIEIFIGYQIITAIRKNTRRK